MPQFTIELDIPPGINADDTTFSATGQWADGDNVRFLNGKPQTVGGESSTQFTLGTPTCLCTDLFAIMRSGQPSIVYGQGEPSDNSADGILAIAADQGTNPTSPTARTPASVGTNADKGWCFQAWGEILLAAGRGADNAPGGRLYEQTGTSTATHVTQAPARNTCILVTNERQVLSFGCNEEISTTFNQMCIRGSDIEDYTDWTTTATNNAFEHILDGGGAIVAAHKIGAFIGVWTTIGLWLGQFLGDPAQTYRFDKVADGMSPYSIRSVAIHDGVAYWVDRSLQFHAWAPGGPPQNIPCPVMKDVTVGLISPFERREFVVVNTLFDEIWFFYGVDAGSYLAYCVTESQLAGRPVWFRGTQQRNAVLFDDMLMFEALGVKLAGTVHRIESDDTCMASAFIKSADFYVDHAKRRVQIQRCRPDFELLQSSAAALNLIVTTRNHPQSTTITTSTNAITSATEKKDFRVSGMIAATKWQSTDTDPWRLGKPAFDCVTLGGR